MANPCIIPLPNDPAAPTSAVHPSAAPASAFAGGQLGVLREDDTDAAYGGVDSLMGTGLRRTGSTSNFGSLDGSFTGSVLSQSGMFLCCLRKPRSMQMQTAARILHSARSSGHCKLVREPVCRCELHWECELHKPAQQQRDVAAAGHAIRQIQCFRGATPAAAVILSFLNV